MTATSMLPELVLRSPEADWDRARWETLPDDGNRYEVIDGVLYMTTAPSFFHQWIVQRLIRLVGIPAKDQELAYFVTAPIGKTFASCAAWPWSMMKRVTAGLSFTGSVFGIAQMLVQPPATAADAPVATVSLYSCPGSRRCVCISMKPGATIKPVASITCASSGTGSPRSSRPAMRPSSIRRLRPPLFKFCAWSIT